MITEKIMSKFRKTPNPNLSKNIKEIGLSNRVYHHLRKADVRTVGELTELSWNDLMSIRGTVRRSCVECEKVLSGMGLGLRKDDK